MLVSVVSSTVNSFKDSKVALLVRPAVTTVLRGHQLLGLPHPSNDSLCPWGKEGPHKVAPEPHPCPTPCSSPLMFLTVPGPALSLPRALSCICTFALSLSSPLTALSGWLTLLQLCSKTFCVTVLESAFKLTEQAECTPSPAALLPTLPLLAGCFLCLLPTLITCPSSMVRGTDCSDL